MGETLNLLFRTRAESSFSLEVRDSWSRRTVSGDFVPPFTPRYLNTLLKKLDRQELSHQGLREIGERLFAALCGTRGRAPDESPAVPAPRERQEPESVGALLRSVIQRTLHRRGTVALTLSFTPGCDEFMRYPWELLHNGEHFLIAAGVFTLTRILVRPDEPSGCDLPVHPPMSMLYIGASPTDCEPLQTERSFEALRRGLAGLIESGRLILNRLEPCTFGELVRYLSSYGGAGLLDDSEVQIPCYVVHFDGHGAYGRICPRESCGALNDPDERHCCRCGTALNGVKAQTYLCFCDEEGKKEYIDTQALREVLTTSDVRLVVLSACETAWLESERSRQRHVAFDRSLATALLTAEIPAVVAMPFSLQDELGPVFMYHFYEALAAGRTLEEALSRARHAMLPLHQSGWFIPVLYRYVSPGCEEPVPLIAGQEEPDDEALLANLEAPACFVGRECELEELTALIMAAAQGAEHSLEAQRGGRLRPGMRHIVLTGPAGIGKSALAFEVARRNREKFPGAGGIIGISLRGGKAFAEALLEMARLLPALPARLYQVSDVRQRSRLVLTAFHARTDRELPCLLLIDSFEEVTDQAEYKLWLRFLAELPRRVVVLLTSHSNPATLGVPAGVASHWYEYPVGKMTDDDLLHLFQELAAQSGLDKRIHLDDPIQQEILREICTLLDGYPLGAALIFGTARSIGGKIYTPEAATRSLEEVRDQLRKTPLAGIWAVLEVAYLRLSPSARLLLSYLSAFKLPFTTRQIVMLIAPEEAEPLREKAHLREPGGQESRLASTESAVAGARAVGAVVPAELAAGWRAGRDELVQASFMGFDGRVYTIHPQVRNFALSYLPVEERRRVHRVVAAYYLELAHPSPEEWFAAFEHLSEAEELQEAVRTAVRASRVLRSRGYAQQLLAMLRRAESYALSSADQTGEGQIQCCLGAILRQLGNYAEALACLMRGLALHRAQHEDELAGWALYELAMLAHEEGHFDQAEGYAREALQTFRSASCTQGEAWAWLALGQIMCGCGRYTVAREQLSTALETFRQLGNQEGRAWALLVQASIYEAQGAYDQARALCEEAQRLFSALGLRIGWAWVLHLRVILALAQERLDEAEQCCSQALEIFHEQGLRRGEGLILWSQGNIWRKRGEGRTARSFYEKALAIFSALGDRLDQARLFNAQGALALAEGALHVAKEDFEQALMIARQQGARRLEGRAHRGLGDVSRSLRLFAEAATHYEQAAAIAAELGTLAEECAVEYSRGELCYAQENYLQAMQHWMRALLLHRRLAHPRQHALQQRLEELVRAHQLEEAYQDLRRQYGL
jgi:tetratricopeptide (TPR) repeat protein